MKSTWNKKLIIQILSVGLVRFLFVLVMILMVSFASNLDSQKLKPVLDAKPVIAKVISSQPIEEEYTAAKIEPSLPPVKGNKKERLFHPIIIQTAIRYQVEPALIKAIIMAESGYNPRAISKKGAKGLMQLMPETAKKLNVEDIFNPQQNIDGGVRYFKTLVNQFNGDLKLALAAYNAGSKTVRQYKGVPPFKETQYYIKKVFEYYQLYKNQMVFEYYQLYKNQMAEEVDRA
jgi:soluble lytic murein transglycosylase-like protein